MPMCHPIQPSSDPKRSLDDNRDENYGPGFSKRHKASNNDLEDGWWREPGQKLLPHADYTIGWICALPAELAASHAMLEEIHAQLPTPIDDTNAYILGSIGTYNIVMACLPSSQYGTNNAATVASNMIRSFPSIRFGLMVGIGGGVPGDADIRLGDIVVGEKVLQHDLGKLTSMDGFQGTGTPTMPPQVLLKAVSKLRALHEATDSMVPIFIDNMLNNYEKLAEYSHPESTSCVDILFNSAYEHDQRNENCSKCDKSQTQFRHPRKTWHPKIHYGNVASGNQVIKCGRMRDKIAAQRGILCFEMEAAGLAELFPCMAVRGICDYADSHKNKQWQKYAAAAAAAYAKELILILNPRYYNNTAVTNNPGISTKELHEKFQHRREPFLELLRFEQMDSRRSKIDTAQLKTCEWLLSNHSYEKWLSSPILSQHHGFLWICGKPGAGKSTMMKFIYNKTIRSSGDRSAVASFFFNARGVEMERSVYGLYRSLLLQVLERFPDIQTILDDLSLVPFHMGDCPTVDVIQDLLREAVMALDQRQLTCLIDALDECGETEVRRLVVYLEGLMEQAVANNIQLRVCFSSRHYPHIDIRYGVQLILEDQPGHKRDLQTYVQGYLRAGSGPKVEQIRSNILDKANGVFLWVVLVVEILNKEFIRGRMRGLERRLQGIANGLSDLFKDMLRRDTDNKEDLLLSMQWMLFAKRPLSVKEFYFAILSGQPELHDDPMVYDAKSDTCEVIDLFVTSSSKGLVEVTASESGTVQFIHESVRDFFVKDTGIRELWPEHQQDFESFSHDRLKACCFTYITAEIVDELQSLVGGSGSLPAYESEETDKIREIAMEKFPFLKYAVDHVFHHANLAADALPQTDFLDNFPLKAWIYLFDLFHPKRESRFTEKASLLYIFAARNHVKLLEKQVSLHPGTNLTEEHYSYPLYAALANGHKNAAKAILGPAAAPFSVNTLFPYRGLFSNGPGSMVVLSPIHWAHDHGCRELISVLIDSGHFDLHDLDFKGRSAIHRIAGTGDSSALIRLVDPSYVRRNQVRGRDEHLPSVMGVIGNMMELINLKDVDKRSPLSHAVGGGHEAVARLLVTWGASLDDTLYNFTGSVAPLIRLIFASGKLNDQLVELLFARELVNREQLMHAAAVCGHRGIVEHFVKEGASVVSVDSGGKSALDKALIHGHVDVSEFLLENGAPTSSITPSAKVAALRCKTMSNVLVKYGITLDRANLFRNFSLHQAVTDQRSYLVELFVEAGADVLEREARTGKTALHMASFRGYETEVKLLLDAGADIHSQDNYGQTPLHEAAYFGRQAVVRLLLEKGAVADCKDKIGRTPRSECTHEAVVKLLTAHRRSLSQSEPDRFHTPASGDFGVCSGSRTVGPDGLGRHEKEPVCTVIDNSESAVSTSEDDEGSEMVGIGSTDDDEV